MICNRRNKFFWFLHAPECHANESISGIVKITRYAFRFEVLGGRKRLTYEQRDRKKKSVMFLKKLWEYKLICKLFKDVLRKLGII